MNTRNIATVAAGLLLAGTLAYAVQMDSRAGTPTPAYQGQNTGTFQMFFSPTVRQDTFLLDSSGGRVWALRSSGARTVFVLHDVEGYQHEEIARLTGIAEGTSKAQLHRARRLLRENLDR